MNEQEISLRIENVKEHVSIFEVLNYYGVGLTRGEGAEQQVSCPFHGHRGDLRKSARVYESSQKFHCFFCGFTLDVIAFVQEYEGCNFLRALNILEQNFSVPQIEFEDIADDIGKTFYKRKTSYTLPALLSLYEFCEGEIIKRKKSFNLKTYSKLFLFLESTLNKLRDSKITGEEAFDQLTKLRAKIEA